MTGIQHTFYSINTDNVLEAVKEWKVKAGGYDGIGCHYDIQSEQNNVRLYSPYKRAYCWQYYDSAEEAENARRMAILAKYGDIKRERARLYSEMRKLRDVINSWKEE